MRASAQLPASRLLMPMSLAASLGTTLTLVSAPAFLLAGNLIERTGGEGLGIFSITPIGIALVVVGMVYMQLARWLLPKRSGAHGDDDYLRLDRYRTELLVVEGSRWSTRPLAELQKALGDTLPHASAGCATASCATTWSRAARCWPATCCWWKPRPTS